MEVRLLAFGSIEVEGVIYEHDVVIDAGQVRKWSKKPSRRYRPEFGHTPLSADEDLPWGGSRLIIGTGAYGSLPIRSDVIAQADKRGVHVESLPTEEACRLISALDPRQIHAVLHVTC